MYGFGSSDGVAYYAMQFIRGQGLDAVIEQLQAQGIVLGIVPEPRFEQRSVTMEPGDVICLYTDGVTEAMDARRRLFDEERLIEVLRRSHELPPDQIIARIIEAVTSFAGGAPQTDDITLVVLKRES